MTASVIATPGRNSVSGAISTRELSCPMRQAARD